MPTYLGQKIPLEEGMATHSSVLAWSIPWTEEPGGLRPMGSQRAGHNCATDHTHAHTHTDKVNSQENPAREVSLSCLTGDGEAGGAGCSPSDPLSHRWKAGGSREAAPPC